MRGTAGEHDDGAWRVCLQLPFVELAPQPDVEDTGDDGVDTVFRMLVGHELDARWQFDPDDVRPRFGRIADDDCQSRRRRERRKRLPVDVLGQNRPETVLTCLVVPHQWWTSRPLTGR